MNQQAVSETQTQQAELEQLGEALERYLGQHGDLAGLLEQVETVVTLHRDMSIEKVNKIDSVLGRLVNATVIAKRGGL